MFENKLTENEIGRYVQDLWVKRTMSTDENNYLPHARTDNGYMCLSNQFYCMYTYPLFQSALFSSNLASLLGVRPKGFTIEALYKLIHAEDIQYVLLMSKKLSEYMSSHFDELEPFKCILALQFRMKKSDNHYIDVFQQTCVLEVYKKKRRAKLLSIYTDLSMISYLGVKPTVCEHNNCATCESNSTFGNEESLCAFTDRELEILSLLSSGKSSLQISDLLNISKHTVDTHRRHMLSKSQVANTAELIAYFLSNSVAVGSVSDVSWG
jgi:DNA-binding CsgD family transcriptional regulator